MPINFIMPIAVIGFAVYVAALFIFFHWDGRKYPSEFTVPPMEFDPGSIEIKKPKIYFNDQSQYNEWLANKDNPDFYKQHFGFDLSNLQFKTDEIVPHLFKCYQGKFLGMDALVKDSEPIQHGTN